MITLSDDDLVRLLSETAEGFAVPEPPAALRRAVQEDKERVRTPLHQRPAVRWLAAASVVIGLVSLLAVNVDGGTTSSDDSTAASPASASSQDALRAVPAPLRQAASTGASGSTGSSSGGAVAAPQSLTGSTAGTLPDQGGVAAPAPDQGRVVKTGQIALEVADGKVSATLTDIQRVATGQGGLVFASTTQESGPAPSGQITIRVPVAAFEATVIAVRKLDADVVSASTKASDVTAQYADLQTQVRTLKATRERYLVILGQADTIGEVLSVQQRVDAVSGQVDQLEGRLKVLGAQSAMSTLAVTVSEKGAPVAQSDQEQGGLSKAWDDAKDGFTGGVENLLSGSGTALIVLLCLVVVSLVGRLGYRVVRRRMV